MKDEWSLATNHPEIDAPALRFETYQKDRHPPSVELTSVRTRSYCMPLGRDNNSCHFSPQNLQQGDVRFAIVRQADSSALYRVLLRVIIPYILVQYSVDSHT